MVGEGSSMNKVQRRAEEGKERGGEQCSQLVTRVQGSQNRGVGDIQLVHRIDAACLTLWPC